MTHKSLVGFPADFPKSRTLTTQLHRRGTSCLSDDMCCTDFGLRPLFLPGGARSGNDPIFHSRSRQQLLLGSLRTLLSVGGKAIVPERDDRCAPQQDEREGVRQYSPTPPPLSAALRNGRRRESTMKDGGIGGGGTQQDTVWLWLILMVWSHPPKTMIHWIGGARCSD